MEPLPYYGFLLWPGSATDIIVNMLFNADHFCSLVLDENCLNWGIHRQWRPWLIHLWDPEDWVSGVAYSSSPLELSNYTVNLNLLHLEHSDCFRALFFSWAYVLIQGFSKWCHTGEHFPWNSASTVSNKGYCWEPLTAFRNVGKELIFVRSLW